MIQFVGILVLIDIALHLHAMWPGESDDEGEDLDCSNPIGFQEYDPEEHEEDLVPDECRGGR